MSANDKAEQGNVRERAEALFEGHNREFRAGERELAPWEREAQVKLIEDDLR